MDTELVRPLKERLDRSIEAADEKIKHAEMILRLYKAYRKKDRNIRDILNLILGDKDTDTNAGTGASAGKGGRPMKTPTKTGIRKTDYIMGDVKGSEIEHAEPEHAEPEDPEPERMPDRVVPKKITKHKSILFGARKPHRL